MSVSFIDAARKRLRKTTPPPDSIEINMQMIPFYREIDGDDHYYVNPPTRRLLGPTMPELAWRHGDVTVTIGRVWSMWSQDMALFANAYINPADVPATSYTNIAAQAAYHHLKRHWPLWVVPFIPTGGKQPYKTRGTAITDYTISKVVLSPSDSIATWRDRKATSAKLMSFSHGKNIGFNAA